MTSPGAPSAQDLERLQQYATAVADTVDAVLAGPRGALAVKFPAREATTILKEVLVKVGRTSMKIDVEAWVQRGLDGQLLRVTEGVFTYVAIDEQRRPQAVHRDKA